MMIRALTVSLLFAVLAVPAYGQDSGADPAPQDNPQTRQTDESEDDYRRSQRRRDTGDIFDDIDINRRSSGSGIILGRETKAIDQLDQESRRHLNKQRAKALAEAEPGEPIDAAYEPSETAKTDEYVAKQEEAAWEDMMEEANSGLSGSQGQGFGQGGGQGNGVGGGQGDQQGQGQAGGGQSGQGQAGQGQQGQSGQGQGSQAGQGQSGQSDQAGQSSSSPLRGGSASSASSILDRIKGRSGAGGGTAPEPSPVSGGGQAPQGQAPQGQTTQSGQAQQSQNSAQQQSSATDQAQSNAQAQANASSQAQAASDANSAAEAAAHHDDPMSPLERLKRDPVERNDTGGRTSAADYLNRKKE